MAEAVRRQQAAFALVLHDVAPSTWQCYRDFVANIDSMGAIPLTLLVVPDYHRQGCLSQMPDFVAMMERRLACGDELVVHGYHHDDPGPIGWSLREGFMRRLYTREGEFFRIDPVQCRIRLEAAVQLFARLGWPLTGFVPPAWLLGSAARAVLAEFPFRYSSDPSAIIRLPGFERLAAPSLVWSARSGWRRLLSRQWNQWQLQRQQDAPLLRLGLHPVDMEHAAVRRYWLETIAELLDQREPLTKIAWLEQQA